ncbi:MAG: imidazole glycerol phosphate synthase subunit HisH [Candidatus Wallbacteria bacterium]|nr:imidazole glycerol phosphate synthase subunit HisH [Candidatus Wallbacteria bacterium]
MIGIIDYGAGNLSSVQKAFSQIGAQTLVLESLSGLERCRCLVLPGVGAFGPAMRGLMDMEFVWPLKEWIASGKPFLGICLGMQVLFSGSEESQGTAGLGLFSGTCRKFTAGKVPQIGWNRVSAGEGSGLLKGMNREYFYFLHSYFVDCCEDSVSVGTAEYGLTYTCAVERGSVAAVQFHPEKSGEAGLRLLKNWVELGI